MIAFRSQAKFNTHATVVCVAENQPRVTGAAISKDVASTFTRLRKAKKFQGRDGEIFPVVYGKTTVLFAGVGKIDLSALTQFKITLRNVFQSDYLKGASAVELILPQKDDLLILAAITAVELGLYQWNKYQSKAKKTLKNVFLISAIKPLYRQCQAVCAGTNYARDLVNENADVTTSEYLEKEVRKIVRGKKNIRLEVLGRKEMKKKGLGLHLAVNQGSKNDPKLVIVKYTGDSASKKYTALVGKGVTFDTGGLNLKPSNGIETMKMDMGGAAAVIGALHNAVYLKLRKNIIFAVGLAENAVDALSYKPGDVIKGYAGKTVEVANTDAEGRLVLADAISYVVKNYKPARLIDIATLTGACIVALGHDYTGLVTTDEKMAKQLLESAVASDDRAWRLPSYSELKDSVKSQIADIRNLGSPRGAGGTLTAAEFLRQFADGTAWAHLDIAGTAFVEGKSRWYFGHGATGAGVRLLTHFLQNH